MSIFECDKCGCIENTALSNYWIQMQDGKEFLCSECDPLIGKWHGVFAKRSAEGMHVGNDGFLYSQESVDSGALDWRMEHQGFKILKVVSRSVEKP